MQCDVLKILIADVDAVPSRSLTVTELDEEVDLSRPPRLYLGTTWILGHAEMASMSIDTIVK
jgi:hypothetical protein